MFKIGILKRRLKKRAYKAFFRQLSYDIRSILWGYRCPLCGCKDISNLKTRSYLPFKICAGCSYDLSLAADGIAKLNSRQLAKALEVAGVNYEQFCRLEKNTPS